MRKVITKNTKLTEKALKINKNGKEEMVEYVETPVGWLEVKTGEGLLMEINFVRGKTYNESIHCTKVVEQLKEYFGGQGLGFRVQKSEILRPGSGRAREQKTGSRKLDTVNSKQRTMNNEQIAVGTKFQRKVWGEIDKIPYGETITYKELARRVGKPKAIRAVANACGANPIPIVRPCHRVVASNGGMGGYGGGIEKKRWLLKHEKVSRVSNVSVVSKTQSRKGK